MVAPRAFPNRVGLSISSFSARLIHFSRTFLHPGDITFKPYVLKKSDIFALSFCLNTVTMTACHSGLKGAEKYYAGNPALAGAICHEFLVLTGLHCSRMFGSRQHQRMSMWHSRSLEHKLVLECELFQVLRIDSSFLPTTRVGHTCP
jgi:hypothetical protein